MQTWRCQVDFLRRRIVFLDALRKRANNIFAKDRTELSLPLKVDCAKIPEVRKSEHSAR